VPSYTIYANTDDYRIQSVATTWTAAKNGTGSLSASAASATTGGIMSDTDGTDYYCHQVFQNFDTSAVSGTITAFSLSVNCSSAVGSGQTYEAREYAWSGSGTGNFRTTAQLALLSNFGSVAITGTGRFSFPKSSLAHTPSATYKLILFAQRQRTDVAPSGANGHTISMADSVGTTNDAFLSITTAAGPRLSTFMWA
jgi:hypothetical protein